LLSSWTEYITNENTFNPQKKGGAIGQSGILERGLTGLAVGSAKVALEAIRPVAGLDTMPFSCLSSNHSSFMEVCRMRDFNDKDRSKKSSRIQLEENPGNLTPEALARLESAVKAALKEGHLDCPAGWKIAKDMAIPKTAIGAAMDKLGARIANCQLGFFRVDKTPPPDGAPKEPSPEIAAGLRELEATGELTCLTAFELARRFKTTPMKISEAANILRLKIRNCQLGCF
jgi:hypothetical protein